MSKFLRFPVMAPNGPDGTYIVNDEQTHAVIRADWIGAVVPNSPDSILHRDNPGGCIIHLAYGTTVEVHMPAEDVYDMLKDAAP